MRLLFFGIVTVLLFSCAPARKAIYFNNLKPGRDSINTYLAELTKRVQYGDRISINIVTKDQEGNQLLNAGQFGGGSMGMNMNMNQMGGMFGYLVDKNGNIPISSAMSRLEIKRLMRLNPNNVLPVALGEPLLLGIAFMIISFRRSGCLV